MKQNTYGQVYHEGKAYRAHRLMFFLVNGWWPEAVRHTCDNPPCIEPSHLLAGTSTHNNRDRQDRGRQAKGESINHAKLNDEIVASILASDLPSAELAALYGVTYTVIHRIWRDEMWTHVPGPRRETRKRQRCT